MNKKKRRSYSKEFKDEAVKLITEQGYSFAKAGQNLVVNRRHSYLEYLSPRQFVKRMALKKAALKMSIFTRPYHERNHFFL